MSNQSNFPLYEYIKRWALEILFFRRSNIIKATELATTRCTSTFTKVRFSTKNP